MNPVMTLKNISAKDNLGKIILNKLNLTLQSGSIHMILGESGSGKSVLVNILAGLYPYQGQIHINGCPEEITTPKKSLKAGLSILIQGDPNFKRKLLEDVQVAKMDLENRKLVEKAKGILMDMKGLKEAEAMAYLQKKSRDTRSKITDVAKKIIKAASLLD